MNNRTRIGIFIQIVITFSAMSFLTYLMGQRNGRDNVREEAIKAGAAEVRDGKFRWRIPIERLYHDEMMAQYTKEILNWDTWREYHKRTEEEFRAEMRGIFIVWSYAEIFGYGKLVRDPNDYHKMLYFKWNTNHLHEAHDIEQYPEIYEEVMIELQKDIVAAEEWSRGYIRMYHKVREKAIREGRERDRRGRFHTNNTERIER